MKNDVAHASAQVDRFIIDNLLEVKETLAKFDSRKSKPKSFGVVDLWNIRKRSRFASGVAQRYIG